jgi:hypothetical protein
LHSTSFNTKERAKAFLSRKKSDTAKRQTEIPFGKVMFKAAAACQVICLLGSASAFNVRLIHRRDLGSAPFTPPSIPARDCETKLHLLNFFGRKKAEPEDSGFTVADVEDVVTGAKPISAASGILIEQADIVVVGGGVSGLTAAITAAEAAKKNKSDYKVILVEAGPEVGGRVLSEETEDGFVLDKGFAVFIEEYPEAKKLLDYDALKLKPFLPGALIKLKSRNKLARLSDPLREPGDTINALLAPVGSFSDKVNILPLIFNVRTKSIEKLFEERETDTETALIERWGFSDDIINKFFKPFLEGIYLTPLSKQSSRMFSFVFKMFSEGAATLPEGGIGAVATQLEEKAKKLGVEIRTSMPVTRIGSGKGNHFVVECAGKSQRFQSPSVVMATDGQIAQSLLSASLGFCIALALCLKLLERGAEFDEFFFREMVVIFRFDFQNRSDIIQAERITSTSEQKVNSIRVAIIVN